MSLAYSHAGPASIELVGAVLRQATFVEKMVDLGWTQPGRFAYTRDYAPLVRCIARYHAFLDLMNTFPNTFFVPTLVSPKRCISLLANTCYSRISSVTILLHQNFGLLSYSSNRTWPGILINSLDQGIAMQR